MIDVDEWVRNMTERESAALQKIAREIEDDLSRRYGELLPSAVLTKVLGYPSAQAYRKALHLGRLPIPVFRMEHRRGHFAFAKDTARWLATLRVSVSPSQGGHAM
jgi:hypothetical protein